MGAVLVEEELNGKQGHVDALVPFARLEVNKAHLLVADEILLGNVGSPGVLNVDFIVANFVVVIIADPSRECQVNIIVYYLGHRTLLSKILSIFLLQLVRTATLKTLGQHRHIDLHLADHFVGFIHRSAFFVLSRILGRKSCLVAIIDADFKEFGCWGSEATL